MLATVPAGTALILPVQFPVGPRTVGVVPGGGGTMLIEGLVAGNWFAWTPGTVSSATVSSVLNVNAIRATATTADGTVEII